MISSLKEIAKDLYFTCHNSEKLNDYLQIRHGARLKLWNIIRKETDKDIQTPIILLGELKALRGDNREMIQAAQNKVGDDVDVTERLVKDENGEEKDCIIALLIKTFAFHMQKSLKKVAHLRKSCVYSWKFIKTKNESKKFKDVQNIERKMAFHTTELTL